MSHYCINLHNNREIHNLFSSALYIASLSSLSTSIPGEEIVFTFHQFSLYSTRIDIATSNISVIVQNISIFIPEELLNEDTDHEYANPFSKLDVLIVGINTMESTVNISETGKDCKEEGTLSDKSVSITILGNETNTSNLSSNIEIVFNCHSLTGCDVGYQCVWYNPVDDTWQNDGCDTIINNSNNKIKCSCSHLTTFATIHNMHTDCSEFVNQLFGSSYWNVINWIFAAVFLIVAIYIC